jgi:hypothetical protein
MFTGVTPDVHHYAFEKLIVRPWQVVVILNFVIHAFYVRAAAFVLVEHVRAHDRV